MPSKDTIKKAVCDVLKDCDVKEAYLFSSYARGEETPRSDIDIRLLCGKSMRIQDLYHIKKELEELLLTPVEIISAPPKELPTRFYDHKKQDEIQLYTS